MSDDDVGSPTVRISAYDHDPEDVLAPSPTMSSPSSDTRNSNTCRIEVSR
jgi:hypothetical protein